MNRQGRPLSESCQSSQRKFVEHFLKSIAVSPEKLLSADIDVQEHVLFMTELFPYASVQVRFERARKAYVSNIDAGVVWARKNPT